MKKDITPLIEFYNSLNPEFTSSESGDSDKFLKTLAAHTSLLLKSVPTEKDLRALLNLVLIHSIDSESFLSIVQGIGESFVKDEGVACAVKLSILCNYYNKAADLATRMYLYRTIIKVAAKHNEMDTILPNVLHAESIISEFEISKSETAGLYLLLAESLEKKPELSYQFLLKYLETLDSASISEDLKKYAQKAIKLAISLKSVYSFELLLSLKVTKALGVSPHIDLIKIYKKKSLEEFNAYMKSHPKILKDLGVSDDDALRKIRILSLSKLASEHVGGFIDYKTVASNMDIGLDQVEFWVIDGIRSRLIDAKLDQLKKTLFISRVTLDYVEKWDEISTKLEKVNQNISGCLAAVRKED